MFVNWFNTFLEEKGLNEEHLYAIKIDGTVHLIERSVVVGVIKAMDHNTQQKFKNKCVELDFKNKSIDHFLKHMAKGVIKIQINEMQGK